jgi:chemotaxis protein histidine kinase CheA
MSLEDGHFVIVIDKVLGKESIVLKKINRFMGRPRFLIGCGVMPFDRICFVLDAKELKKSL